MKCCFAVRIFLLAGSLLSAGVLAQDRAGKVDTTVQFNQMGSETIGGEQGSSADIDSSTGYGFSVSYNLDNYWAFGIEFDWREADYTARVTPAAGNPGSTLDLAGTLEIGTTALTGTYHFSPSNLAPFVTANIGRTWVDTNIPSGPPTTVCWYDPWWGYYCGPTVPTKSDDYWSYGAGLGLRWDSSGPFFARASVNEQWLDVGGPVGTPSFTLYRIDLGARF